jgi:hypothetical protein
MSGTTDKHMSPRNKASKQEASIPVRIPRNASIDDAQFIEQEYLRNMPSLSSIRNPPSADENENVSLNNFSIKPSLDSNGQQKKDKKIEWSKENEMIMVEWCDVAQCYKWLNSKAHLKYSYMNAWFTIPAITLSTITGTASFAQTSIPVAYQQYAPMVIGSINILIGILTTVQQYLKISELNEAHRVSAISWDKFARNIRIELAKSPKERAEAATFIKMSRQEFDRLMETSPAIPQSVLRDFKATFSGQKNLLYSTIDWCLGHVGIEDKEVIERRKQFDALKKPDICDIIISSNENRHKWYEMVEKTTTTEVFSGDTNDLESRVEIDIMQREEELRSKEQALHDKEKELMAKEEAEEKVRQDLKKEKEAYNKSMTDKIEQYVNLFVSNYGRRPLKDEITDNFKSVIDVEIVNKYLENYVNTLV